MQTAPSAVSVMLLAPVTVAMVLRSKVFVSDNMEARYRARFTSWGSPTSGSNGDRRPHRTLTI